MSRTHTLSVFDSILPETPRISAAPSLGDIHLMTDKELNLERERRYKSVDEAGNLWLVQNPNVWDCNQNTYHRPPPCMKLAFGDVLKQSGGFKSRKPRGTDFTPDGSYENDSKSYQGRR